MRATYVPPVLTPATPEHVSRAYRTALTNLVGAPSDEAVAVLHAHGALETGHFKSCYNHNGGNIKAGQQYVGAYTCFPILNEVFDDGTHWYTPEGELEGGPGTPLRYPPPLAVPPGEPQSRFRAYSTLASGIEDKIRFLARPEWRPALNFALTGNPDAFVRAIKARGYFTANVDTYARSVVQLTAKYLPVARATSQQQPTPPIEPDSDSLCRDMAACFRFPLPPELAARIRIHQAEHIGDVLSVVRADRDRDIKEGD